MLLQVVTLAWDVDGDFLLVRKPDSGNLSERRVWLLRGHRADLQADAPLLRAAVEHRRLGKLPLWATTAADKLADRRHKFAGFAGDKGSGVLVEASGTTIFSDRSLAQGPVSRSRITDRIAKTGATEAARENVGENRRSRAIRPANQTGNGLEIVPVAGLHRGRRRGCRRATAARG
jgi:hypothetical protein